MSDFNFEPRGRQTFQQQHQYPDQGIDLFREVRDLVFSGGQNGRGCDRGCSPRDFDQFDQLDRSDRMHRQRDSIPWSRGHEVFDRHNSYDSHNRFNTRPGFERQFYPDGRHHPQSDYYLDRHDRHNRNDFGSRHRPGSFQPFPRHQNQDLGRQIINRVVVPLIMNEIFGHRQRYQPDRFRRW